MPIRSYFWPHSDLNLRKIAIWMSKNCQKLDIFQQNWQKLSFFQQIANGNFLEKNYNFWQLFWKNVKILAIFWQSNGNFPEVQVRTNLRLLNITHDRTCKLCLQLTIIIIFIWSRSHRLSENLTISNVLLFCHYDIQN